MSRLLGRGGGAGQRQWVDPILTICRSGGRSARAAATLRVSGYTVVDVAGGMRAWQRAGLPVVASGGRAGSVI